MVGRDRQRALTRARLANIVQTHGRMSLSQLAKASGMPVNAVNAMVRAMASRGHVRVEVVTMRTPNRNSVDQRQIVAPVLAVSATYPGWMTGQCQIKQECDE